MPNGSCMSSIGTECPLPSLVLFEGLGFARWGFLPKVTLLDSIEQNLILVGRHVCCLLQDVA
jgi:hypothetical protein